MDLYPLKFEPIIIEKVWGGTKLRTQLNKSINTENAGESWEISGVENRLSRVSEGKLKGKTIKELINTYKAELIGQKTYDTFHDNFPILIKFIDADDDLSVQVHPDDQTAMIRHRQNGKNEMWYILESDRDAHLILGVKKDLTKPEYIDHVEKKTIASILNKIQIYKGDAAFIPAGRIHAIMKGAFLAEIQQTSDITYRIFDWNRPNLDGSFRELHTEEAKDVVELNHKEDYMIRYDRSKEQVELCSNKYFKINRLKFQKSIKKDYSKIDSFIIYIVTEGECFLHYQNKISSMKKGESILIPACMKTFELFPKMNTVILEVYI